MFSPSFRPSDAVQRFLFAFGTQERTPVPLLLLLVALLPPSAPLVLATAFLLGAR